MAAGHPRSSVMAMEPAHDPALPGVPRGMVWLAESTARWGELFAEEAARLRAALGPLAIDVQHFGSTSVPGLRAKPILDILVGAGQPVAAGPFVTALAPLGYEYVPKAGVPDHLVFGCGVARTRLVHVVGHDSDAWRRPLRFRDRLRADPSLAESYERLKLRLAADYPGDRARYTSGKETFILQALGEQPEESS